MKILYIILISLVCFNVKAEELNCKSVGTGRVMYTAYRCENSEVICYYLSDYKEGGLSCKFK